MSKKIDVSIVFYGKPYQTIVTIKTFMQFNSQYVDKIYLSGQAVQPHNDYVGLFKVIDYFRNTGIKIEIWKPHYFVSVDVNEYQRAKTDTRFRQSILHQYPLETTDKKYLCMMHNDMLFHKAIIGDMLEAFEKGAPNLIGTGSIGQCWSCPAGPNWGNKCNSDNYQHYVPTLDELTQLTQKHATPRREIQLRVIHAGRVHPLPECRLNEYCALLDVEKYRRETLPQGDIGCFGGGWAGVDTATAWSHDIYQRGYTFKNFRLEDFATHAPFDVTGSGTHSYSSSETYWGAEKNAENYLIENFGPLKFSTYVPLANAYNTFKRRAWLGLIHTIGFMKKLAGKH